MSKTSTSATPPPPHTYSQEKAWLKLPEESKLAKERGYGLVYGENLFPGPSASCTRRNFSSLFNYPLFNFFFFPHNGQTSNFPVKVPGCSKQETSVISSSLVWCKTRDKQVAFSQHLISPSLPSQLQKHRCCGSWAMPGSCNFLRSCSLSLSRFSCPIRTNLGFFPWQLMADWENLFWNIRF